MGEIAKQQPRRCTDTCIDCAALLHRLWLNGGPGCSSFDGFIYEQGPFLYQLADDRNSVRLVDNPFAWSKVATMIFLDSPSGEYSYRVVIGWAGCVLQTSVSDQDRSEGRGYTDGPCCCC